MDGIRAVSFSKPRGGFQVIALWCCLLTAGPLTAQDLGNRPDFDASLHALWDEYLQAKTIADEDARDKVFQRFREMKRKASGEIFETAGYLFLEEGFKDFGARKYESARREFLNAAEMNPYLWPAYMGLAQIKKDANKDFSKYLELNLKGLLTAFNTKNTFFVLDALVWFLRHLYWTLMVTACVFTLMLCLKYLLPFLATTVHGFENYKMKPLYTKLLALCILLLPLFLGVNYFLAAALFMVLFFPFLETGERWAGALIFGLAIISPFLNLSLSNVNYARSNPLLKVHLTQYFEGDFERQIAFLESQPGRGEIKNRSLLTLGKYQKALGLLREAHDSFQEIPKSSKYWPLAQVNMGNIQYLAKEYQKAIDSYKRALQKKPNLEPAYYNLSVVYTRLGNPQEAENYRAQANKIDPIIRVSAGEVVDAEPSHKDRLFQALAGEGNPFMKQWFRHGETIIPVVLGLLFWVLALLHLRIRNTAFLAKSCEKCGDIFYPSDSPNSEWCSQCVNLYIKKDDLPSEAKIRKYEEVAKFIKRKHWLTTVCQILIPGAKKVIRGSALAGLATLLVWCFLIIFLVAPLTDISHPYMRFMSIEILTLFAAAITLVYWLIFGLLPIWQED